MSPTILLIEDDEILRDNFCEMLEMEEFNVIGAEDGLVGLQLAKHIQPDLILCDINIPKISGYGVLHKIREDASLGNTPFIFLASESSLENRSKAMYLGANDYIGKGEKSAKILQAIAQQLDPVGLSWVYSTNYVLRYNLA